MFMTSYGSGLSLCDPELARTVMTLNSTRISMPQPAYVGTCWFSNAKHIIVQNVQAHIEEATKGAISRDEYVLAKVPAGMLGQTGSRAVQQSHPSLDSSLFTLTLPQTTDMELRWLPTTLDKGMECVAVVLPSTRVQIRHWKGAFLHRIPTCFTPMYVFVYSTLRVHFQTKLVTAALWLDVLPALSSDQCMFVSLSVVL